jgi:hypothetical protein
MNRFTGKELSFGLVITDSESARATTITSVAQAEQLITVLQAFVNTQAERQLQPKD